MPTRSLRQSARRARRPSGRTRPPRVSSRALTDSAATEMAAMTAPDRDDDAEATEPMDCGGTLLCTDGPALCRVRHFTDAEWHALPVADRPARHQHIPGLGWLAALPVECLN